MFSRSVNRLGAVLALGTTVLAGSAAASGEDDAALFQPPAVYQAQSRRDPFVQPQGGLLRNVMTRLDIEVLKLTGVISHPGRTLALFTTQTGPRFGYLLKDGKLFGENHRLIGGVTGQVLGNERVVLKQGNKRIEYRLR
jgi:hypothetical protein